MENCVSDRSYEGSPDDVHPAGISIERQSILSPPDQTQRISNYVRGTNQIDGCEVSEIERLNVPNVIFVLADEKGSVQARIRPHWARRIECSHWQSGGRIKNLAVVNVNELGSGVEVNAIEIIF